MDVEEMNKKAQEVVDDIMETLFAMAAKCHETTSKPLSLEIKAEIRHDSRVPIIEVNTNIPQPLAAAFLSIVAAGMTKVPGPVANA